MVCLANIINVYVPNINLRKSCLITTDYPGRRGYMWYSQTAGSSQCAQSTLIAKKVLVQKKENHKIELLCSRSLLDAAIGTWLLLLDLALHHRARESAHVLVLGVAADHRR